MIIIKKSPNHWRGPDALEDRAQGKSYGIGECFIKGIIPGEREGGEKRKPGLEEGRPDRNWDVTKLVAALQENPACFSASLHVSREATDKLCLLGSLAWGWREGKAVFLLTLFRF